MLLFVLVHGHSFRYDEIVWVPGLPCVLSSHKAHVDIAGIVNGK